LGFELNFKQFAEQFSATGNPKDNISHEPEKPSIRLDMMSNFYSVRVEESWSIESAETKLARSARNLQEAVQAPKKWQEH
jgi:hypothetical protein